MGELIPANVLHALPPSDAAILTGHMFFPELMSGPFKQGLAFAFTFSAVLYLIAAAASWRGGKRPAGARVAARHQEMTLPSQAG
jgi:hypothetical protein